MQLEFEAIGTSWKIDFPDVSFGKQMETEIKKQIESYDQLYSRFRTDSYLWSLSEKEGTIALDTDGYKLLSFYKRLYEITEGLVTPLIGSTLSQVGYDKDYSLIERIPESPLLWDQVIDLTPTALTAKQPVLIDIGAAGKGQVIDIVSESIETSGINEYTVDAGGDIRIRSLEPARIGLEDPKNHRQVIGVAQVTNQSICGSAGNRRVWGKYHHILNPKTLQSVDSVLATWVIAETTMHADGLSTALFFVEPEKLTTHFDFVYVILYPDYSVKYSKNFQGEIF